MRRWMHLGLLFGLLVLVTTGRFFAQQLAQAVKVENGEFAARVTSGEAEEAFEAFLTKCKPT